MISVVIPAYGRIPKLKRAVESVLDQKLLPAEIIIVDDCSPDPIRLEELPNSSVPIRLLRHDKNRGGSGARNTGIIASQYDFIAFLDSDDSWYPNKLAIQMERMQSFRGEPVQIVSACNVFVERSGGEGHPYNLSDRPANMTLDEWFLTQRGTYQTSGILLPTSLARDVLFDERLRRHQDWDFLLRLEKFGVIIDYIPECLSIYYNDDDDDTGRLSRVRSAEPTLTWFRIHAGLLQPPNMLKYYLNECFLQHFRSVPLAAINTLMKLTFFRGGFIIVVRYIRRCVRSRLQNQMRRIRSRF